MSDRKWNDTIEGVGCNVETCAYNSNGQRCHAETIYVQNGNAHKMDEAFCGTFKKKSDSIF